MFKTPPSPDSSVNIYICVLVPCRRLKSKKNKDDDIRFESLVHVDWCGFMYHKQKVFGNRRYCATDATKLYLFKGGEKSKLHMQVKTAPRCVKQTTVSNWGGGNSSVCGLCLCKQSHLKIGACTMQEMNSMIHYFNVIGRYKQVMVLRRHLLKTLLSLSFCFHGFPAF